MNSVELSKKARLHCIKMVYEARASHIASALSIIDILSVCLGGLVAIYDNIQRLEGECKYDDRNIQW